MPTRTEVETSPLLLLDTHIAVWLAEGNPRLKASVTSSIKSGFDQGLLCLSPISAWEIGLLVAKGRLDLGQPPKLWFFDFVRQFNASVVEMTPEIAIESSSLPGRFHGDPADRILVATALAHCATLVSADKNIQAYGKQGFVRVIGS
jgi:PIN domain nuclease of toxin-antitoxin system